MVLFSTEHDPFKPQKSNKYKVKRHISHSPPAQLPHEDLGTATGNQSYHSFINHSELLFYVIVLPLPFIESSNEYIMTIFHLPFF